MSHNRAISNTHFPRRVRRTVSCRKGRIPRPKSSRVIRHRGLAVDCSHVGTRPSSFRKSQPCGCSGWEGSDFRSALSSWARLGITCVIGGELVGSTSGPSPSLLFVPLVAFLHIFLHCAVQCRLSRLSRRAKALDAFTPKTNSSKDCA